MGKATIRISHLCGACAGTILDLETITCQPDPCVIDETNEERSNWRALPGDEAYCPQCGAEFDATEVNRKVCLVLREA